VAKRTNVRSSLAADESERVPLDQRSLSRLRESQKIDIFLFSSVTSESSRRRWSFLKFISFLEIYDSSQFVISPKSLDKEIKLQIPIVLATYPLRPEGAPAGTAPSKRGAHYPSTLPIFRPWLDDKAFEIQE